MTDPIQPSGSRPIGRPRLLIVDDEPKNLRLLANIFADQYELSLATSGAQALNILSLTPDVELILLDLMMPELDGHQVYERLQAQPSTREIPVIFVTARHDAESEIAALDSGAMDYLHKPVSVGLARARVRQQITLARQRRELQAARVAADAGNRAKSRFLTGISHELRTPLNAILGFSQMLRLDDQLTALQAANVREIQEAGQHLLDLINDVLDLGKIEAARMDLHPEPVAVMPLLGSCARLLEQQAQARGIRLNLPSADLPLQAWADPTRFRQILVNLLSNAIKYNREGGQVTVRATVDDHQHLRIEVQDTGPGIEPELRPQIFDAFQRGEHGRHQRIEGTGIGLTIAKRLVELMGGTIDFDSQAGHGTTFWFTLPLHGDHEAATHATSAGSAIHTPSKTAEIAAERPADPAQSQAAAPAPQPTQTSPVTATILCVDDNPSNLRLLEIVLRRLGQVKVVTTPDPSKALILAAQHQPNLILLDIQMPEIDGYEVLRRIRSVPALQSVPVAALSANAMEDDVRQGLASGFADYLTKPFEVMALLKSVQRLLARERDPS